MLSAKTVKILRKLSEAGSSATNPAMAAYTEALPALVQKGYVKRINGAQTTWAITPKGKAILAGHESQVKALGSRNTQGLK